MAKVMMMDMTQLTDQQAAQPETFEHYRRNVALSTKLSLNKKLLADKGFRVAVNAEIAKSKEVHQLLLAFQKASRDANIGKQRETIIELQQSNLAKSSSKTARIAVLQIMRFHANNRTPSLLQTIDEALKAVTVTPVKPTVNKQPNAGETYKAAADMATGIKNKVPVEKIKAALAPLVAVWSPLPKRTKAAMLVGAGLVVTGHNSGGLEGLIESGVIGGFVWGVGALLERASYKFSPPPDKDGTSNKKNKDTFAAIINTATAAASVVGIMEANEWWINYKALDRSPIPIAQLHPINSDIRAARNWVYGDGLKSASNALNATARMFHLEAPVSWGPRSIVIEGKDTPWMAVVDGVPAYTNANLTGRLTTLPYKEALCVQGSTNPNAKAIRAQSLDGVVRYIPKQKNGDFYTRITDDSRGSDICAKVEAKFGPHAGARAVPTPDRPAGGMFDPTPTPFVR